MLCQPVQGERHRAHRVPQMNCTVGPRELMATATHVAPTALSAWCLGLTGAHQALGRPVLRAQAELVLGLREGGGADVEARRAGAAQLALDAALEVVTRISAGAGTQRTSATGLSCCRVQCIE